MDDNIIDIFNHKIYKQLQMVDGIIPEEYVYNLGDDLYAYEVYSTVAFNVNADIWKI